MSADLTPFSIPILATAAVSFATAALSHAITAALHFANTFLHDFLFFCLPFAYISFNASLRPEGMGFTASPGCESFPGKTATHLARLFNVYISLPLCSTFSLSSHTALFILYRYFHYLLVMRLSHCTYKSLTQKKRRRGHVDPADVIRIHSELARGKMPHFPSRHFPGS